ncbi:TetR/AcrR family transcriptional regulator [Jannaschia sp. R86511]|uniref:TetR/AcrR family transcriptional regulator n=1 Tax=Jannaschia sp. R86511 TaxID=3093853 RepID=UPI0036D296A1
MPRTASEYHQRVSSDKRAAILTSARTLFTRSGYDKTSLARVADEAGVSTATVFKQFPNKAALFEALVLDFWTEVEVAGPAPTEGDPASGLSALGTRYAALLLRDGMAGLFRLVIAEAPQFPELARIQFDLGKAPFFDEVRRYVEAEHALGSLRVEDPEMACTQFLGMIANYVLWPRMLLVDFALPADRVQDVVESAVLTFLARYDSTQAAETLS